MDNKQAAAKMQEACARECEELAKAFGIVAETIVGLQGRFAEASRNDYTQAAKAIRALKPEEIIGAKD